MDKARFLLGRGELLTETIPPPKKGGKTKEVYTFKEALKSIRPKIIQAAEYFDQLDSSLCPGDYAVGRFILNPAYIAKSYFPSRLFQRIDLIPLGSKNVRITPRKWARKAKPVESLTTAILVAGTRSVFRNLPKLLDYWRDDSSEAKESARIEDISAYKPEEKFKTETLRETNYFASPALLVGWQRRVELDPAKA